MKNPLDMTSDEREELRGRIAKELYASVIVNETGSDWYIEPSLGTPGWGKSRTIFTYAALKRVSELLCTEDINFEMEGGFPGSSVTPADSDQLSMVAKVKR